MLNNASVTAPNIIQKRKLFFPVQSEYAAQTQPQSMRSANQKLCRRSGVKPKQEIYRQSFDIEITAKSAPAMSSSVHINFAARLSRTGFDELRVTSQRRVKFMAMTRQSSKKPSRAYCETMKP